MDQKRIAIIGAGPSGLLGAKSCLEEEMDVVIYEKTDDFGGLWRYRDNDEDGTPSVMKSTVINTSKEISAFSDFPPPKEYPNFMHNSYMLKYFEMYAKKFGLLSYVRLNSEVTGVSQTDDYERTGRWNVTVKNTKDGSITTEAFDGVMVCTGHHTYPHWPKIEGLDEFEGTVTHSHSLKKSTGFEDKRVLVIGIGNSAVDAAVELSTVAKQVYLSTRHGAWLYHRVGPDGRPYDTTLLKRNLQMFDWLIPYNIRCWYMERIMNQRFNHETYGLKPKHRILSQHPTVNDALPNKILSGTVILREDVKKFTKTGVLFKSDDQQTDIDAVILATGYDMKFPFISEDVIKIEENKVELYKYMFPPQLTHPSLAIIALVQVLGSVFPAAEIQCRWYALLVNGKKKLPTKEAMMEDIKAKNKYNSRRYVSSPRHTVQVDYIQFLDEIASLIGCKPNLFTLLFTDPKLFWALITGPSLPYQYRLSGPHSWSGAREAILEFDERVLAPLSTRKTDKTTEKKEQNGM